MIAISISINMAGWQECSSLVKLKNTSLSIPSNVSSQKNFQTYYSVQMSLLVDSQLSSCTNLRAAFHSKIVWVVDELPRLKSSSTSHALSRLTSESFTRSEKAPGKF